MTEKIQLFERNGTATIFQMENSDVKAYYVQWLTVNRLDWVLVLKYTANSSVGIHESREPADESIVSTPDTEALMQSNPDAHAPDKSEIFFDNLFVDWDNIRVRDWSRTKINEIFSVIKAWWKIIS